ncbi:signal peptidase II [Thermosyntropha lipolytica DSM 11003]|uniref:Lipoprotein signal peptidase n=1 Tax=Thermosyntropha lipolytica DSM 11003 TaxID=1123382 RepID=A0A1M5PHI5_9FIRM|nr:signal peptidase II [Thermosyntropha lipolytica]SHH01200.1 signal peptidase II [Thermosyntropha lipolytica DSM 11003]
MRFFLGLIILLVADQLSKYAVITNLELGEKYPVIDEWFTLTYIHNKGAAFGIMEGGYWFFVVAALLAVAGMIYYVARYKPHPFLEWVLGIIAGGALGNLIDRIFYQSVIDFISIGWWPVFNLADVGITVGSVVLIFFILYSEKNEEVKNG